jgi:SPX domain protein involved in polyphosphate accumulation
VDAKNMPMKKIPYYNYCLFPYFILEFTMHLFDKDLLALTMEVTNSERIKLLKELSFTVGSFILPKYMMKSF